ncbi:cupin domain-containing protein [Salisediminibacterium selenitireducens]|uniref:DUF985 domain-containing protein n=1 Tax=Bacillus selenitireducens (strain ATCC 700615 / DSM 15326 / MLS10) TaxID=439292 RepID=D6XZ78_BACIE|nr:cupin domain-containing protein [Salisediminibacterium selenitireducens]ADI00363.1 protein of unknown function DUF985 [[Bacillus] selenitireducens MLS10]
MKQTANAWINAFKMEKHPEGGYYKPVYKSGLDVRGRGGETRAAYTSIYFLLGRNDVSRFHKLTADEIWYYHAGAPLTVHMIDPKGRYETARLGLNLDQGEQPQLLVPAGIIFGATPDEGHPESDFALVSCMVAPGFEFSDFTLFDRKDLLAIYPQHEAIVRRLTRP